MYYSLLTDKMLVVVKTKHIEKSEKKKSRSYSYHVNPVEIIFDNFDER